MFRFMERLDFLIAYLALVFLTGSVAIAQPPPMPSGMPEIHTIELTDESAKNSIDTYITLREKYGNKVPPANESQALSEGRAGCSGRQLDRGRQRLREHRRVAKDDHQCCHRTRLPQGR